MKKILSAGLIGACLLFQTLPFNVLAFEPPATAAELRQMLQAERDRAERIAREAAQLDAEEARITAAENVRLQALVAAQKPPKQITMQYLKDATVQFVFKKNRRDPKDSSITITTTSGGTGSVVGCSLSTKYPNKFVCYVLTAAHIEDSSYKDNVVLVYRDGKVVNTLPFEFIGVDKAKEIALAKIYVDDPLPSVSLVPSTYALQPKATVIGIGCRNGIPPNVYSKSTDCVVSIEPFKGVLGGVPAYFNSIHTTCIPQQGDSGGPLFDVYGRLIGVCSSKSDKDGLYSNWREIYPFVLGINNITINANGNIVNK